MKIYRIHTTYRLSGSVKICDVYLKIEEVNNSISQARRIPTPRKKQGGKSESECFATLADRKLPKGKISELLKEAGPRGIFSAKNVVEVAEDFLNPQLGKQKTMARLFSEGKSEHIPNVHSDS